MDHVAQDLALEHAIQRTSECPLIADIHTDSEPYDTQGLCKWFPLLMLHHRCKDT